MKWRVTLILLSLFTAVVTACAQSSTENRGYAQKTQAGEYWIDPSTGLMWPAKDHSKAVTWHKAESYCRKLHLAGYSDWRLPTLDELASLVDKSAATDKQVGKAEIFSINLGRHLGRHLRGNLALTGDPWRSNRQKNRFGHPYGPGWFFDFINSKPSYDLQLFRNTKYALCVRRSGK